MIKTLPILALLALFAGALLTGCSAPFATSNSTSTNPSDSPRTTDEAPARGADTSLENVEVVQPEEQIIQLEEGLSAVRFEGDYGFAEFLEQGGANSDAEVVSYLNGSLMTSLLPSLISGFGCSTIAAQSDDGTALFGRNFDWQTSDALVVSAQPKDGYASISTVNRDFLSSASGVIDSLPDNLLANVALFAPLDGANEQGLAAAVLMIQDGTTINQNTDKPDLTTTTALRLLLDKAANVNEAVELLSQYDLHSSMDIMVHFALADASGHSVVVEYVNNEMQVVETPVATNFYLAEGEKQGIGSVQSHERYNILSERLSDNAPMNAADVRDALDSVSKDNFDEFESTEWSIVYNLSESQAVYYHRENYQHGWSFTTG